MLTLIHKSMIPITDGTDRTTEMVEKLYFSKILKIKLTTPEANKNANR